jgi:hypothetical protein
MPACAMGEANSGLCPEIIGNYPAPLLSGSQTTTGIGGVAGAEPPPRGVAEDQKLGGTGAP